MVIGGPSSGTIAEEDDMSVCKPSNSSFASSNQNNECPFELLSGECLIDTGRDLTDGRLYLTNYRLFIYSNQSTSHCSFINYPIRLIESYEIKDNICLCIQCKDNRSFRLLFTASDRCCYWLRKLTEAIPTSISLDGLFAMKYFLAKSPVDNPIKYNYFHRDIIRLQLDKHPWRITDINRDYKLCPSYPNVCVVHTSITDDEVQDAAKFRSLRRFPTIVWKHRNGAVIARASQPEVGLLLWRSKGDEKMTEAIINACKATQDESTSNGINSHRLLILDARSYAAALVNRAKGGGFEYPPNYIKCDVEFMNLPNIHVVRKSSQMLRCAIVNEGQGENWLSQLESSRWLNYLSALIQAASQVVATVDKHARSVLIHCSDGWDRTPQISTLAKLMLDPFYRTIEGFQILIQSEWIAFGHKFSDRCGHGNGTNDPNERSPIFLQWIDCVYQLFRQYPTAFEFNEIFLLKLANHTYSCLYGTFLCNTNIERLTADLDNRTFSIWNLLNSNTKQLVNHLFDRTEIDVLHPVYSIRDLVIWSNLYLRDVRYTSDGSFEHSSTLIPARTRSYDDLSASMSNNLHRSASDSALNELLSINNRPNVNPSYSNVQQSPSNRLLNSTSTNSLFGLPHQLGTPTDNPMNSLNSTTTNPSLPTSPDNQIKQRPNFSTDEFSPDIVQLVSTFQRFPLNVNSVDSILRTVTRPRKHTNSMSSTTSSLSETSSLTRINSYEQNQAQRMIQHLPSNKLIKLIRKRIDSDGLTKVFDQITLRMLQKERAYKQKIENLNEQRRQMERFICALIYSNQNQRMLPRMEAISQSNASSFGTSSFASWQKVDSPDAHVVRWMPDFNVQMCHGCHSKFQYWPISRKHHCRRCGNVFCYNCANYSKVIPRLNDTDPVRVCHDCFLMNDDNNTTTPIEMPRTTTPIAIQSGGCRQTNGSFNSPGGQKTLEEDEDDSIASS